MGNSFVACIVYAHDISLLSPTASGLQEMLDACSHFVDARLLKFNVKKSAVTVFRRMKRSMGSVCAEFRLCGQVLPVSDNLKHIGIVSRFDGKDTSMVESRVRKFYAAANAAMGKLGIVCRDVEVWKIILERQLFPVLSYGCHLWRLNIRYVRDTVNTAWRRVIRKGLGMKWGDSVKEKLGSWFKEASELMKRNQCLFIHRAVHSQNNTVREVSMATRKMETSRVWNSIKFIGEGSCRLVFVHSYKDLKVLLKAGDL